MWARIIKISWCWKIRIIEIIRISTKKLTWLRIIIIIRLNYSIIIINWRIKVTKINLRINRIIR